MIRTAKVLLIVACGLLFLLLAASILLWLFLDLDAFKPRIEAAAAETLDMEVEIAGPVDARLFPVPELCLDDVRVSRHDSEWLSSAAVCLRPVASALLLGRFRTREIDLTDARVRLVRDAEGRFNFIPDDPAGRDPAIRRIRIRDTGLSYVDQESGLAFEAAGCGFRTEDMAWRDGEGIGHVDFSAELECVELAVDNVVAENVRAGTALRDGVLTLDPLSLSLFGGQGRGRLVLAGDGHRLDFRLDDFQIERFMTAAGAETSPAEGRMHFIARLAFEGRAQSELLGSLHGTARIRGGGLILRGRDLDEQLAQYDSARHFNFVDVGAFFFAGPAGVAITRGYEFAGLAGADEGATRVSEVVSDWRIADGMATADDVALSTAENRIALQGRLNFPERRFDDLIAAVVDSDGCALLEQEIHGTFGAPEFEQPSILEALTAPIVGAIEDALNQLGDGDCEAFYTGAVEHPR